MKFLPWIGAAICFLIGELAMKAYGTIGGFIVLVPILALWWWVHTLKEKKMTLLYGELMKLDHEKRSEALADLPRETRDEILKRRRRDLRT